jgi:hypothetical protein
MSDWPKHPDGSPMKYGEMPPDQRRAQWKAAAARAKERFTLVFAGDLTTFDANPHTTDTPFGCPIASALGDKLAECDGLEEQVSELDGKLGEAWSKYGF